jgi:hypothetical protein
MLIGSISLFFAAILLSFVGFLLLTPSSLAMAQQQPFTVEIIISNEVEQPTYTEFLLESNVTGGTAPYIYSWEFANGTIPAANMLSVTVSLGATSIVTVTVIDSNNQTASDSIQLTPTNGTGTTPPIQCPIGRFYNATSGQCESRLFPHVIEQVPDTTPPVIDGAESSTTTVDNPALTEIPYYFSVNADDNVDGHATYYSNANVQQDNVGGGITIQCSPDNGSLIPIGTTSTFQCTAVDQAGNIATYSWTIAIQLLIEPTPPGEILREQLEGVPPPPPSSPPTEPQPEPTPEPTPTPEPQPEPEPEPEPPEEELPEEEPEAPPANDGGGG